MRQVTNREQRLLLIFTVLLFLVLNLFGFSLLSKNRQTLERTVRKLDLERQEARVWMAQKDLWLKRKEWMDHKQPKPDPSGQDSAQLLEFLQQGARQNKITITDQKLLEPRTEAEYREASVRIEVRGSLEPVVRWLAGLQAPERFQAITSLTLKSDAEPPKVICNLTIARWYALKP